VGRPSGTPGSLRDSRNDKREKCQSDTVGDMRERLRGDGKIFKGTEFVADIRCEIQINSRYKTTRRIRLGTEYRASRP
jgi:hypothetical protein